MPSAQYVHVVCEGCRSWFSWLFSISVGVVYQKVS